MDGSSRDGRARNEQRRRGSAARQRASGVRSRPRVRRRRGPGRGGGEQAERAAIVRHALDDAGVGQRDPFGEGLGRGLVQLPGGDRASRRRAGRAGSRRGAWRGGCMSASCARSASAAGGRVRRSARRRGRSVRRGGEARRTIEDQAIIMRREARESLASVLGPPSSASWRSRCRSDLSAASRCRPGIAVGRTASDRLGAGGDQAARARVPSGSSAPRMKLAAPCASKSQSSVRRAPCGGGGIGEVDRGGRLADAALEAEDRDGSHGTRECSAFHAVINLSRGRGRERALHVDEDPASGRACG